MSELTLSELKEAVDGTVAAFRCKTTYQPVGGRGDKVFPPTYEGGKYATEDRIDPETGEITSCVLLDSVQSQANRMELALLESYRRQEINVPLLTAKFDDERLIKKFTVTSLDAPHRVADALFRDSLIEGKIFRKSEKGRILDFAEVRNATGLFGLCPTALLFGMWDSTGPRGGLGAKFQRAIVSEIVGYGATAGVKTSSRIDPAQIMLAAGPLHARRQETSDTPDWTLDVEFGGEQLGKDGKGKPSEANHGNVMPGIVPGGFTISKGQQTTVISLSALRRLLFPIDGAAVSVAETNMLARTVLAALGLAAATLARNDGDLRSRCHLFPSEQSKWEVLDRPGKKPMSYDLTPEGAVEIFNEAVSEAVHSGLPWEGDIELSPSEELLELVRRSQESAVANKPDSE